MTYKQMLKLQKVRDYAGLIGWCLMLLNLFIGTLSLISSLINGISVTSQHNTMGVIFFIAMVIGIMAAIDGIIARRISKFSKENIARKGL